MTNQKCGACGSVWPEKNINCPNCGAFDQQVNVTTRKEHQDGKKLANFKATFWLVLTVLMAFFGGFGLCIFMVYVIGGTFGPLTGAMTIVVQVSVVVAFLFACDELPDGYFGDRIDKWFGR